MHLFGVIAGVLWCISRVLERVYCICQEFSLVLNFKSGIVWVVSWGLGCVFDRVCCNLSGVLFGAPC